MNLQGREFGICQSPKQSLEVLLSMLCMLWNKSSKRLFYIYQTLSEKVTIFRVDGRLQSRSNYNAQIYVRDAGNTTKNYCEKDRTSTSMDLTQAVFSFLLMIQFQKCALSLPPGKLRKKLLCVFTTGTSHLKEPSIDLIIS